MYNMLGESNVTDRFINSIYQYIDVGVLVECDKHEHRSIREVGFFTRTSGKNCCTIVYENGEFTDKELPEEISLRFRKYGIDNPFGRYEWSDI